VKKRRELTLTSVCGLKLTGRAQAVKHSMNAFGQWRETTAWKRREVLGNVSLWRGIDEMMN
jgi:DNA gyrase inhibitor GyrI